MRRFVFAVAALAAAAIFAMPACAAENAKPHRIAIQVDQNDPALMNLVLNNVSNLTEYYHSKGEQVQIEVVAYGPGLNMLREDKSPVKDRLKRIKEGSFPSTVNFSACHNTMMGMEKAEGHPIPIVPEAKIVACRCGALERVAGAGLELSPAVNKRS
jgi:intracellular sulfur oxidation DsrE/DsrF family protein